MEWQEDGWGPGKEEQKKREADLNDNEAQVRRNKLTEKKEEEEESRSTF